MKENKKKSENTGLLKHKTEKNVETEKSTGVRFKNTKTTMNGQSNPSKYFGSVLGGVTNKPADVQQYWGYFRS